jgi:hypothetical protein
MLFYSPHPNPLQQERELSPAVTYCFIMSKSYVDTNVLEMAFEMNQDKLWNTNLHFL